MATVTIALPELNGHPDILAMLQAFYSRSHMPIKDRLDSLDVNGEGAAAIREKLKQFYINYSHASIGDCANITLFVEDVSMLTAKALQDRFDYSGQESSSRYIDFSKVKTPDYADDTYHAWMNLYTDSYESIAVNTAQVYGLDVDSKANKVAAFDVARGLLPCGAFTKLSITASARMLREHVWSMMHTHPLRYVAEDAKVIWDALADRYPELFGEPSYIKEVDWFLSHRSPVGRIEFSDNWSRAFNGDDRHLPSLGSSSFYGKIDFGSYRDLQRHRSMYIKSNIPDMHLGPHPWYMSMLPAPIFDKVTDLWDESNHNPMSVPMMAQVCTLVVTNLPAIRYVTDLRTTTTVHHTMRKFAHDMARSTVEAFPNLQTYLHAAEANMAQPVSYDRRATQDIQVKA